MSSFPLPEPLPEEPARPELPPGAPPEGPLERLVRSAARAAGRLGWRLNLLLLLATFGTTTLSYAISFADPALGPHLLAQLGAALTYSVPVLLILGSHEMGHYVFCRWYGVRATLPYFIPAPPIVLSGTFGAVIRMRPPIPSRRALFDIGIAGPIAGFIVAVPVLVYGLMTARVQAMPEEPGGYLLFGDSILTTVLTHLLHGPIPDGSTLLANGPTIAGWFGLLVTAMNLFPVGQLDGGHVTFALSPGLARSVSRFLVTGMVVLVAASLLAPLTPLWPLGAALAVTARELWPRLNPGLRRFAALGAVILVGWCIVHGVFTAWLLWTVVLVVLGRRPHPPVENASVPPGPLRVGLAVLALVIFVLCFMPFPLVEVPPGS